MSPKKNNQNIAIGKRVKKLRLKNQYTLKKLSEETGLSIGFLSQLERDISTVAIDSLGKIAAIFNVELSYFFEDENKKTKEIIVRSFDQKYIQASKHTIQYTLSNDVENFKILPRIFMLLPSESGNLYHIESYSHDGEEFLYILEGVLTLFIDNIQYTLYPGDSIQFDSQKSHNWMNMTNNITRFIAINSPNPLFEDKYTENE